jgi:hypothetical protein
VTQVQRDGHRMLVLRFAAASYALSAADLAAIDQDGAGARIAVEGPVHELAALLPLATPSADPVRLIVGTPSCRRAFRAYAELELVETSAVYRLPRLLRDAGCAPWIRGVALLGSGTRRADPSRDHEEPTLWIDLARLAAAS